MIEDPDEYGRAQAALAVRALPAVDRRRSAGVRNHLDHRASPRPSSRCQRLDPEGETGRRVRFLDRFFDHYVMGNMQRPVADTIRPEGSNRDPFGVEKARGDLHKAYDWLEANLGDGPWAVGAAIHDGGLRGGAEPLLRRLGRGDRRQAGRSSPATARACSRIRPSRAPSTRAGPFAAISRWARRIAIEPQRNLFDGRLRWKAMRSSGQMSQAHRVRIIALAMRAGLSLAHRGGAASDRNCRARWRLLLGHGRRVRARQRRDGRRVGLCGRFGDGCQLRQRKQRAHAAMQKRCGSLRSAPGQLRAAAQDLFHASRTIRRR